MICTLLFSSISLLHAQDVTLDFNSITIAAHTTIAANGLVMEPVWNTGLKIKQGNKNWPKLEQDIPETLPVGSKLRVRFTGSSKPGGAALAILPWDLASTGGGHMKINSGKNSIVREYYNDTDKTLHDVRFRFYFADSSGKNRSGQTINVEDFSYEIVSSGQNLSNTSTTPPVVKLNLTPKSGKAPLTVSMNAGGSYDADGSIVNYVWNDDSGNSHSGYSATQRFDTPGTYSVKLTVKDNSGASTVKSTQVNVSAPVTMTSNQSPIAKNSATPTSGTSPVVVSVNAGGSEDTDGQIVRYSWDFGDGTSSTGVTATHKYTTPGNYTLKLTVEDNLGKTGTASRQISVISQPVSAGNGQCENPGSHFNMTVPSGGALAGDKPRVFVTTDIRPFNHPGEYDDKLSTITLMLFTDVIDLEGIAGHPDPVGRIIDSYRKDLGNLRSYSAAYPDPSSIKVSKSQSNSDGGDLLLQAAKKADSRPLYVLTWGSLGVVSDALEKAAQENFNLASKIRLLSVGLGNVHTSSGASKSFLDVYAKVKQGKLWMVLDQQGHRGIFSYTKNLPAGNWKAWDSQGADNFVDHNVKSHGNLGNLYHSVRRNTRMGDFPTLMYLMRGNPNQPTTNHWGGRFISLNAAHKFGTSPGADKGLQNFWTDTQGGSETYNNPWRRPVNTGTTEMVTQYAMQWLPEFADRYDRAKYRKGTNPAPMDVFKYTTRCQ